MPFETVTHAADPSLQTEIATPSGNRVALAPGSISESTTVTVEARTTPFATAANQNVRYEGNYLRVLLAQGEFSTGEVVLSVPALPESNEHVDYPVYADADGVYHLAEAETTGGVTRITVKPVQRTATRDGARASRFGLIEGGVIRLPKSDLAHNRFQPYGEGQWQTNDRIAVILHGLLGSAGGFTTLSETLKDTEAYDQVWYYEYDYRQGIAENGLALANELSSRIGSSGQKVDVYAHSMGGLVSRYAIESAGAANYVRSLITMGTPHKGAALANTAFTDLFGLLVNERDDDGQWRPGAWLEVVQSEGLRDLEENSDFIRELNGSQAFRVPTAYFTVGGLEESDGDGVVNIASSTYDGLANQSMRWVSARTTDGHDGYYQAASPTKALIEQWLGVKEIRLQLVWDTDRTDVDLHLVRPNGTLFVKPDDCYFANRTPDWGEAGNGVDDPALDFDDVDGFGAENLILKPFTGNLDQGSYSVYVNYWSGSVPTNATLHVWVNGERRESRTVTLTAGGGQNGTTYLMCTIDPNQVPSLVWRNEQVRSRALTNLIVK